MLTLAVLLRRGLLSGTVEEILTKAAARPDRQIQIGTPSDAHQHEPVLLHLTQTASYGDHNLKAVSSDDIRHAVNEIGFVGGLPNLGAHAPRRGAAQDANHLKDGRFKSGTSHEVSAALGHSKVSAVKGLTNMYANGHIENLGRARESLLPRITPFTNMAIGAVRDTSATAENLWSVLHLDASTNEVRRRTEVLNEVMSGVSVNTLSSRSRAALLGVMQADEIAELGRGSLFSWNPSRMCNFLATHNILSAPITLRGRYQSPDMLWQLLNRYHGSSRDDPIFRIYHCTHQGCDQWSFQGLGAACTKHKDQGQKQ